jgi:hypothetical protein
MSANRGFLQLAEVAHEIEHEAGRLSRLAAFRFVHRMRCAA